MPDGEKPTRIELQPRGAEGARIVGREFPACWERRNWHFLAPYLCCTEWLDTNGNTRWLLNALCVNPPLKRV